MRDEIRILRIRRWLKFLFAVLTCLGGLALAAGTEDPSIPAVAIFFAVFAYLFVDWLELFALPPVAAYAAMGLAALYCVSDFADMNAAGNHQMTAVSRLLVMVQAILMMQRKTRRIFEQLGIFVLLEMVVAAVFHSALGYGLLLIPISLMAAAALGLLMALEQIETISGASPDVADRRKNDSVGCPIHIDSGNSAGQLAASVTRRVGLTTWMIAPAVFMIAIAFFYALPRTADALRPAGGGKAMVGFGDELRLGQIGRMMQNPAIAMRVRLTDINRGDAYRPISTLYLRGRTVERYQANAGAASGQSTWSSAPMNAAGRVRGLPPLPADRGRESGDAAASQDSLPDPIRVDVTIEAMRTPTLFAIAPYGQSDNSRLVAHRFDRWTMTRGRMQKPYSRTNYGFSTTAFRGGLQTNLIRRHETDDDMLPLYPPKLSRVDRERLRSGYDDELLVYPRDLVPTAGDLARTFRFDPVGQPRTDYQIVNAIEAHLSSGQYGYELDSDRREIPGLDPLEQFLSVDRRGNCQFFASAAVMMLRSLDIPARIVLGFATDEYNELADHFVVRQLHAHAWAEALIDGRDLGEETPPAAAVEANWSPMTSSADQSFWVRLDPTPTSARPSSPGGRVNHSLDLAQNLWDDYVVDMDGEKQRGALLGTGAGFDPMNQSYDSLIDRFGATIARLNSGTLGGGALASRSLFSWPAAMFVLVVGAVVAVILRARPPRWLRRRGRDDDPEKLPVPRVTFYAETLDLLRRAGVRRDVAQTPAEIRSVAAQTLGGRPDSVADPAWRQPLDGLTDAFYRSRFGFGGDGDERTAAWLDELRRFVQKVAPEKS